MNSIWHILMKGDPMSIDTQAPPRGPMRRAERALAPDLARGAMLLFIAVANAVGVVFGAELAAERHPAGVERWANGFLYTVVHARAYPMFAVLFGYGLVQLATRQRAAGATPKAARKVLLRRNAWLVAFGAVHAALLYSGDFLGAYGLVGLVAAWLLLRAGRRAERVLLWAWAVCVPYVLVLGGLAVARLAAHSGPAAEQPMPAIDSLTATSYPASLVDRVAEWPAHTVVVLPFIFIVWLGMWAARRRVLEEPAAHLPLLRRVAAGGLALAFLGGLPLALVSAGVLTADAQTMDLLVRLQGVSGMFGGPGYVALFGLLAARLSRGADPRSGRVVGALTALGQRSLSGYLFQSVAWLVLLAPYTLALGRHTGSPLLTALAVAVLTWLATVLGAAYLQRRSRPGPAEAVLRRLTYGRRS
jgi:uncharacterized protein